MKSLKIKTKDGDLVSVDSIVYNLKLGDGTLRVFIHDTLNHINSKTVSEYRTGQRLFDITSIDRCVHNRLTNRQIAQLKLDELVTRIGLNRVQLVISQQPEVN